jgi:predicted PurR-regulated permease PerM
MVSRQTGFLILLTAGTTLALAVLLSGFWRPIFWAVVLGILFRPVFVHLENRLVGRPSVAAAVTLVIILIFVLTPALLLLATIAVQAVAFVGRFENGDLDPQEFFASLETMLIPELERLGLDLSQLAERLQAGALRGGEFLVGLVLNVGQNAAALVINFFLMLYLLFFILRDGEGIYARIFAALPLAPVQNRRLFERFSDVAMATLKGTFAVGIVQGTLGGAAFALVGIPSAVLWGALMAIASVVPVVGTGLVWGPAAIGLALGGEWTRAVLLLAIGTIAIGASDNLVRPVVVGRQARMPDYLVLFSTLGGLSVLGISGLVLGPVIAALFLAVWQIASEAQPS